MAPAMTWSIALKCDGLRGRASVSRGETAVRIWNWLMFVTAPALLGLLGYQRRWVTEDAFISYRVARNLVDGYGPVFNIDERVEAHTNPLWVALLATWNLLGGRIEHGAIVFGIALSVLGIVMAQLAAMRIATMHAADPAANGAIMLPFGALIFAMIPVAWDFVTSGLETGMSFAWLGTTYWAVTRVASRRHQQRERWPVAAAVLLGLGPLVRPDLGVFSIVLFATLLACLFMRESSRLTLGQASALTAGFMAIPVTYQVFRMGYYAALVPNTALAKAAAGAQWSLGWDYLIDFIQPYALWLPLTLLLAWTGVVLARSLRRHDRTTAILIAAPVVATLIHALYIIRIGGDFMHGRLLLPSLFGLMLPVAVVRIPTDPLLSRTGLVRMTAVAVVAIWGLVAALSLRVPPKEAYALIFVADERSFYVEFSGHPNPVTLDDFKDFRLTWLRQGREWQALAERDARTLVIHPDMPILRFEIPPPADEYPLKRAVSDAIGVVAPSWNIGMTSYAAGPRVHIVDRYGLADPIAARVAPLPGGRPGHAKALRMSWVIARYADPTAGVPFPPDAASARAALRCDPLAELIEAVEEPLTPGRFFENIWKSWQFTTLRVPSDPVVAASELCGTGSSR